MASTTWSLDFCLVCDRQTLDGAYCSQTCRLAEIDRYSIASEPSSPTAPSSQPWDSTADDHFAFQLQQPAVDFSAYKGFPTSWPADMNSSNALTPSSSHTSLTSLGSTSSSSSSSISSALPCQIRCELQDYAGCFDQVRDWKRRLTSS